MQFESDISIFQENTLQRLPLQCIILLQARDTLKLPTHQAILVSNPKVIIFLSQ